MSNNFGDRYNPRYDFGMMRNNNEVEESTNTNTNSSSSSSSSSTRCKFWDFILGGNYSQLVALLKNDTNDPSYSPGFLNDPIISTELTSSLNFLKKDPILISIFYVFGGFQSSAFLLNNTNNNQENDESKFFINLSKNYHHHHHHQQQNEENDLFWLIGVSKSKETINLSKHFSKILQILNRLPHNNNNNNNNNNDSTTTTTTMVENNKRIRKKRKGINNNDIDNYSNKNSSSSGWWLQDELRTALLCMNRCNEYLEGGKTIPNDVILLITDIYLKSYIEQAFHNVVSAIEKNCTAGGWE